MIIRQFHRHYLGLGGSARKKILKVLAFIISIISCAKRLIQIAPSGYLEKGEIIFRPWKLRGERRRQIKSSWQDVFEMAIGYSKKFKWGG